MMANRLHPPLGLLCLILAFFATARADCQQEDNPVPPEVFTFRADIPYATDSNRQKLDILFPAGPVEPRPLLVFIHGGGWLGGDKGGENTLRFMVRFAEKGFIAASIGYRFSDEAPFPAQIEDCKAAVRYLRAHAEEYGIDAARVGAIGGSAGGHLSAMLALTRPEDGFDVGGHLEFSSAIQAAVPVCPPTDLRIPICENFVEDDPAVNPLLGGPPSEHPEKAAAASPVTYVHSDAPPLLLIHGGQDKRVLPSQSESLAQALEKVGAPVELFILPEEKHGVHFVREGVGLERAMSFFETHLIQ
jgi:acetyl esterase/lipase